ncbi:unnamed protein product [Scytosiphon promiscuus]
MPPGVMGGGSDGGAVLAAIDFGAVPESSPAAPAGAFSGGYHVQLEALRKIHAQKAISRFTVRTLMRSVAELKKRLALATAQGKDHRRSAMIRAMRTRLREQALVIDVVKEEMGLKAGVGKEEINDWVIRKTVGGPLRFRPKTREELQNELYRLEKKHRQALDKLKARSRTGRDNYEGDGRDAKENRSHPELASQVAGADLQKEDARTTELMRLSDALEEVDALRVSVRSRDSALQTQAEEIDQLQLELRELGGIQERLERNERRVRDLKSKNARLAEQHTSLLEDFEACQEQARKLSKEQIHHLKAQLALRKEEALAVADEFQEQSLRQAEEVGVILKREEELTTALEEEVASRHRERREHHHTDRQASGMYGYPHTSIFRRQFAAVARAEAAENRLHAAEKQARRLGEQNATMLAEIQRLGSEAAEAAGLRERGRELAVEKKRLATEAEARQGRLEEARERGATAEEALRASKASRNTGWEFLEAEKLSKETLTREVSEVRVLLDQERALLEAERNKSNDEAEARRRLESLLVAERKKEEDMGIAAAKAAAEASSKIAAANAATAAAMAHQAAAVKGETKTISPRHHGDTDNPATKRAFSSTAVSSESDPDGIRATRTGRSNHHARRGQG